MIIKLKLDVMKIRKELLFTGKNGAKYLDVTLLENRNGEDQYGNAGMAVQEIPKEEREAGKRGPILGNYKIVGVKSNGAQSRPTAKPASASEPVAAPVAGDGPPESDDVPF